MDSLDALRKAMKTMANQATGLNIQLPSYLSGHQSQYRIAEQVMLLPEYIGDRPPMQNTDPVLGPVGEQFFTMDIHGIDENMIL